MKKVFLLLMLAAPAYAKEQGTGKGSLVTIPRLPKNPWDYDLHLGAGFGSLSIKNKYDKDFGGVLTGLSFYSEDALPLLTSSASVDLLTDATSLQVIRKSAAGGLCWNFVGGKKLQIQRLLPGVIATINPLSIGWQTRIGYSSYALTPTVVGADTITGANMNLDTGLRLTWKVGHTGSLGIDATVTVLSLAMSVEDMVQKSTEITLGWRDYL